MAYALTRPYRIALNFILAVVVTALLIFLLLLPCEELKDCTALDFPINLEFMINRYQTLITGIIALWVGRMAVKAVQRQITAQQNILNREKYAAQSELLLGIAESCLHYATTIEAVVARLKKNTEMGIKSGLEDLKSLPSKPPFFHQDWKLLATITNDRRKLIRPLEHEIWQLTEVHNFIMSNPTAYANSAAKYDLKEIKRSVEIIFGGVEKIRDIYALEANQDLSKQPKFKGRFVENPDA